MIVRIMEEGQFRVDDALQEELNRLDNAVVAAMEMGDTGRFTETFGALLTFIREKGSALPDDELHGSDVIIPSQNTSFEEARELFQGEGLVPG